ncbi:hypothetical protein [Paenibacillus sp. Leaf72]|uniref:hypothetical protein n=1 Tax=Paenibacillus sp. Leaf72 TaxID=1736234 RepID=UPI0007004854|nr:hypothetical protein [Paenibacillus sp. Leaf72]KQO01105.1 hypothetical protein ASF12_14730 [Paenibacillus sp. Leaf72]
MFEKLDRLLSVHTTADSWYDDGFIFAGDMLSEFSPEDWEELSSKALAKPLEWQRKLAYCMDSSCNIYELKILLSLLNTEDEELFEICIDTLRSFATPDSKQMMTNNPIILDRVHDLLPKSGIAVKKILEDFIVKFYS